MLKKWGPALLIAVVLSGLLIWSQCVEPPVEKHSAVTAQELREIAKSIVFEFPNSNASAGPFEGSGFSVVSEKAKQLMSIGSDMNVMRRLATVESVADLELGLKDGAFLDPKREIETIQGLIALISANFVIGNAAKAYEHIELADFLTGNFFNHATSLEGWTVCSASRLLYIESLTNMVSAREWDRATLLHIAKSISSVEHRRSLRRVLRTVLFDKSIKSVSDASKQQDLVKLTAEHIFSEPTEDAAALIAALLYRHTRVFSPKQTITSMSHSVKSLMESLGKPWVESEKVLDLVAESQAIWIGLDKILQMDDISATTAIKELKIRIDSTENPVGLALINRERLAWSNLVQSAYVADAKEALLRFTIESGTEGFDPTTILDPLSGKPFIYAEKTPKSSLKQAGKNYPFIRAFAGIKG